SGESPPALSINYNHTTCTWGIGVSGTLDVEYTANSNGNVSTTDQRIHVATVSPQAASGLPMSGSTLLPICYVYSPSCNPVTAGAAEFYFLNQTGYSHDDPNVPPIVLNWSITATPVQVE